MSPVIFIKFLGVAIIEAKENANAGAKIQGEKYQRLHSQTIEI